MVEGHVIKGLDLIWDDLLRSSDISNQQKMKGCYQNKICVGFF